MYRKETQRNINNRLHLQLEKVLTTTSTAIHKRRPLRPHSSTCYTYGLEISSQAAVSCRKGIVHSFVRSLDDRLPFHLSRTTNGQMTRGRCVERRQANEER